MNTLPAPSFVDKVASTTLTTASLHGWKSVITVAVVLLLEQQFPLWDFPRESLYQNQVRGLAEDPYVKKHINEFSPSLPANLKFGSSGANYGNCQDDATLLEMFGECSRNFEFRVRKGLHLVTNFSIQGTVSELLARR